VHKINVKHYDIIFVCSSINMYCKANSKNPRDVKVLDMAAGWFDRATGCAAMDCDLYIGYDPNRDLEPYYQKITEFLSSRSTTNIIYKMDGFENSDIPEDERFDIVLISPPYYTRENYSSGQDSITRYRNYDMWMEGWMFPMLEKALNHLLDVGWAVISVDNSVGSGTTYGPLYDAILNRIESEILDDRGIPKFKVIFVMKKVDNFDISESHQNLQIFVSRNININLDLSKFEYPS